MAGCPVATLTGEFSKSTSAGTEWMKSMELVIGKLGNQGKGLTTLDQVKGFVEVDARSGQWQYRDCPVAMPVTMKLMS